MGSYCLMRTEFQLCKMKDFWKWVHNNMNVLNITELGTLKWLRWQILCITYNSKKIAEEKASHQLLLYTVQWFSNCVDQRQLTWEFVRNFQALFYLLNQKLWGWGPEICGLTSFLGDSFAAKV